MAAIFFVSGAYAQNTSTAESAACQVFLSGIKTDNLSQIIASRGVTWETHLNLSQLKKQFVKDGQIDWEGWRAYRAQQPGDWIRLSNGREIRILILRSQTPDTTAVDYHLVGGFGYDLERHLIEGHSLLDQMNEHSNLVLVEIGGLTELQRYFENGLKIPEEFRLKDTGSEVFESINVIQSHLKNTGLDVRPQVHVVGLSAAAWFLTWFAAQEEYQNLIRKITLISPGGQSTDEYYIKLLRPLRDIVERSGDLQQPFVDIFNSSIQSARTWGEVFGFPIFEMLPMAFTFRDQVHSTYFESVESTMGTLFDEFKKDKLRLKFATARVQGLRRAVATKMLRSIDPRIAIEFFLAGKDMIVPPGLFADMITAAQGRNWGRRLNNLSVFYFESLEHDLHASQNPLLPELTSGFNDRGAGPAEGRGFFIINDRNQIVPVNENKIIRALRFSEPGYQAANLRLLRHALVRSTLLH